MTDFSAKRKDESENLRATHEASNNPSSEQSIPQQIIQQAGAAAAAVSDIAVTGSSTQDAGLGPSPSLESLPPPPYTTSKYGEIDVSRDGLKSGAKVVEDGRVDIKIEQINNQISNLIARQLTVSSRDDTDTSAPQGLETLTGLPCPPLNIVIQVVGSRGDVQPFVALGQLLQEKYKHRVRLATHPVFRDFVTENGLEFFSIGGDPAELMAFMVKHPGLMPGIDALRSGDVGRRRKDINDIVHGCWRSCIEPGDGTGAEASDDVLNSSNLESSLRLGDPSALPFVADAIIANPPSWAHVHIAEKLGIPLHMMFTMPWSPTQKYPHPLANIVATDADRGTTNFLSYILVDLLTWQGFGDIINRFREKTLGLQPVSILWAPGYLHRMRIPWTYCWSPALIPKPSDWSHFIDIAGFYFLDLSKNYTPEPDLAEFLAAGPPPVYIGFGSIVVDDADAMTRLIFEAVELTGQRALVSKGWGGLSAGDLGQPDNVFMLGNCPHDWLFPRVSCVVHHGGAGTCAAGVRAGKPTVVVPFFGDQPFWGSMINQAGAGPAPIHHKSLTAQNLADAIIEALKPQTVDRAAQLSKKIESERGPDAGAESFHKFLQIDNLRCSLAPGRVAVWRVRRTNIKLSALAATVLADQGLLDFSQLRLYRAREYDVDAFPPEPISGASAALIGTIGSMGAGIADFPSEVLKSFKKNTRGRGQSSSTREEPSQSTGIALGEQQASQGKREHSPDSTPTHMTDSGAILDDPSEETTDVMSPASSVVESTQGTSLSTVSTRAAQTDLETPATSSTSETHQPSTSSANKMTVESGIQSAKAAANIVGIGLRSPLDFTMSLARGFHNAPRLYNDRTVRPHEKVTGFSSGLKVAGKNFAYGFMDGIGGLVTQPIEGAKEEGGVGLVKGFMKGTFGLILKPGSAIYGLPAFFFQGIYAEIAKNFGKSTTNYIIAARVAQGYEELRTSGEGERKRITAVWLSKEIQTTVRGQKAVKRKVEASGSNQTDRLVDEHGQLLSGWRNTRHLSWEERKELARRKAELQQQQPGTSGATVDAPTVTDEEYEQAIREAVQRTSTNDAAEDRAIENAIRASVNELRRSGHSRPPQKSSQVDSDDDESEAEAYQRAVAASIAEYQSSRIKGGQQTGVISSTGHSDRDNQELASAVNQSLAEQEPAPHASAGREGHREPFTDDDEDENLKRALAESLRSYTASTRDQREGETSMPSIPHRESDRVADNRANAGSDEEDAELRDALKRSEQEHTEMQENQRRRQTEDEMMMERVRAQSLQEFESKKRTG